MNLKRNVRVIVIGVLLLIILRAAAPYILVANSIPGRCPLSEEAHSLLLNQNVERIDSAQSEVLQRIFTAVADQPIDGLDPAVRRGGVHLSRIILANLLLSRDVEPCNKLIRELEVFGNAGSSWARNTNGDYDFALIWLTSILYEFGDDEHILHPDSRDYLLNVLLTEEGRLNRFVPKSGKLVFDTENHLLMREGSRYLKNQWLARQGPVSAGLDNHRNGLHEWLVQYLNHMRLKGVYEYNSVPYMVYTLLPLMNLADYAESDTIRSLAGSVIDNIMLRYAYGSLNMRQCAPFRRQFKYAESPSLMLSRLVPFVNYQLGQPPKGKDLLVFASAIHGYSLPREMYERFAGGDAEDYLAVFAHEHKGGAEIYSGGLGYLLSAGGAYQGNRAKVIARPITLLLDDEPKELDDCIHIRGSNDWKRWNMSGVHRRFAVAKGSIFIPEKFGTRLKPGWNVVNVTDGLKVACYQGADMALLAVLPQCDLSTDQMIHLLQQANPNPAEDGVFQWPEKSAPVGVSSIGFDIHADAGHWVITSIDGKKTEPDFEKWPFMQID